MANDIISKKTRLEFREYFMATTLREIEAEFDSADVPIDVNYSPRTSGQRRCLVEQYYHAINWKKWADVRKVLTVYENVLASLEDQMDSRPDWVGQTFKSLKKWIERDGFKYENGKLIAVTNHRQLEAISEAIRELGLPELTRQIDRMKQAVDDDPGLAVGTAKELVESVCKTMLEQRNISFHDESDIGQLVKAVRNVLGLIPEAIPNSAKGSETIRRLLGNLGNVVQGLAELRNLYGTGHGKHGTARGLYPRHARLAVGSAATLATFLFETHIERGI